MTKRTVDVDIECKQTHPHLVQKAQHVFRQSFSEILVETLSGKPNSSVRNVGLHGACNYIISNSVTRLQIFCRRKTISLSLTPLTELNYGVFGVEGAVVLGNWPYTGRLVALTHTGSLT